MALARLCTLFDRGMHGRSGLTINTLTQQAYQAQPAIRRGSVRCCVLGERVCFEVDIPASCSLSNRDYVDNNRINRVHGNAVYLQGPAGGLGCMSTAAAVRMNRPLASISPRSTRRETLSSSRNSQFETRKPRVDPQKSFDSGNAVQPADWPSGPDPWRGARHCSQIGPCVSSRPGLPTSSETITVWDWGFAPKWTTFEALLRLLMQGIASHWWVWKGGFLVPPPLLFLFSLPPFLSGWIPCVLCLGAWSASCLRVSAIRFHSLLLFLFPRFLHFRQPSFSS